MPPKALLATLDRIWSALEALDVPMALMGGLALSVWKHVRATHDVDLLVGMGDTSVVELLEAAARSGLAPRRNPPTISLGALSVLQLEYEPADAFVAVQVDLLLADSTYHREALERRVPIALEDMNRRIFVLSNADLILHKLLAGRIIDLADAAALLRANRDSLELPYLRRWTRELKLESDLQRAWQEAFPGESLPAAAP